MFMVEIDLSAGFLASSLFRDLEKQARAAEAGEPYPFARALLSFGRAQACFKARGLSHTRASLTIPPRPPREAHKRGGAEFA
jgi:hypothetical protein